MPGGRLPDPRLAVTALPVAVFSTRDAAARSDLLPSGSTQTEWTNPDSETGSPEIGSTVPAFVCGASRRQRSSPERPCPSLPTVPCCRETSRE